MSLGGEEGDTEGERDPPREVKPLDTIQLVSIFSESGSIVLPQCSRSPLAVLARTITMRRRVRFNAVAVA